MVEIFSNLIKTVNAHVQEGEWTPSAGGMKRTSPKHTIIKLLKTNTKQKTLKASRKKINK